MRGLPLITMRCLTSSSDYAMKNTKLWRTSSYINGKWTDECTDLGTFDVYNPATGGVIAKCSRANRKDVIEAAEAAHVAWKSWRATLAADRASYLRRLSELMKQNVDDLAFIMTMESGKPIAEAKGEINYAKSFLDFYAEEATRTRGDVMENAANGQKMMTLIQSVGPAALITPWNFPAAMITRKIAPALAAGCTVILKPSEETPLTALALCALTEEAGIPSGVINCLAVGREEVAEVGAALCNSPLVRKVSFTGSTDVGKWLMRESASTVKRISLELGGNAPFIIFDDADLDVAVKAVISTKFRNAGQACIASNRILVQENVYDEFAQLLANKVSRMKCGNGMHRDISIGPLINKNGLEKVTRHVQESVAQGAAILLGGVADAEMNRGGATFYPPTILLNMTEEMTPFREETFGPVAPLMKFKTEDEAIAIANNTKYGLAGYACTRDIGRIWRLAEAMECGMIGINNAGLSSPTTPFGGIKESGIGREGGRWGLEEYLEVKYVGIGYESSSPDRSVSPLIAHKKL